MAIVAALILALFFCSSGAEAQWIQDAVRLGTTGVPNTARYVQSGTINFFSTTDSVQINLVSVPKNRTHLDLQQKATTEGSTAGVGEYWWYVQKRTDGSYTIIRKTKGKVEGAIHWWATTDSLFTVQSGVAIIPAGQNAVNVPITAVASGKAYPWVVGAACKRTSTDLDGWMYPMLYLTSTTNLQITLGENVAAGDSLWVSWEVREAPYYTVQADTFVSDATRIRRKINTVDLTKSFTATTMKNTHTSVGTTAFYDWLPYADSTEVFRHNRSAGVNVTWSVYTITAESLLSVQQVFDSSSNTATIYKAISPVNLSRSTIRMGSHFGFGGKSSYIGDTQGFSVVEPSFTKSDEIRLQYINVTTGVWSVMRARILQWR